MIALSDVTAEADWQTWLGSGAPQDFDTAVEPWLELLHRIARRQLGRTLLADDAVQEGLLQVYSNRSAIDPARPSSTVLGSAVYFSALALRRAERRRRRHEAEAGDRWARRQPRGDYTAHVTELLSTLDEPHRQLLCRRYLDGQSVADLSRALGISAPACAERLHRARQSLRQRAG